MNFMSEVDDLYFLPPATVRNLSVDYEIVKLNDIWGNEESPFPKDKTDKTPVSNVKIEPGAEVQDCSLWEKDPDLNSTESDQFSHTTLVENGMSLASKLLRDNFQEENGFFCNSNMTTCNNISSIFASTNAEDIKYLSSEISDTSKESNRAIKKKKTTSFDEISKEKVMNENIGYSNNKVYDRKVDSFMDSLQSLAEISPLTDTTHNSTEIPIKITNSEITNKNFNNNLSKNIQKEGNEIENRIVQRSVSPPLKSNTIPFDNIINSDVNATAKETTYSYIQSNNTDSSLKMIESKKEDVITLNSPKIENVPKNCKITLEMNSVEDNFTNESINMSNISDDKSNKNIMNVDKNSIYQCLKNWRKNYPWVSVEDDSWIFSCSICSYYAAKTLQIYQIKTSCDIYQVAKYLRNHNILPKHRLLNYFGNFNIFQKIYETLKGISKTFLSKHVLYENIKGIVKYQIGCLIDDLDIDILINTAAQVFREVVINTIRSRKCCGVSFVCDPCRNILIVKYSGSQNYPQESMIISYVNSDPPLVALKKDLFMCDLEMENLTFGKIFNCSSCYPKFYDSNKCNENILPLMLPQVGEFLDLMRKTNTILAFDNFVWSLSYVYNENSQYFQPLNGHAILKRPVWGLCELNSFIFENFFQLKVIIKTKYQFSTDPLVCYCKSYDLDPNPSFSALINAISCIANYLNREKFEENIRRDLSDKMEKFLQIMKGDKVFHSTYEEAINVLSLYYKEILNENYYNGMKNIPNFAFLFEPIKMKNLLANNYEAYFDRNALSRIFYFLRRFLPLPVQTYSIHLTHFGNHLLKISTKSKYHFYDIIELFNNSLELQRNYSYILQFYIALGTLPFIRTNSSSSLALISILSCYLKENFNSDISNSLLTILKGGPTLTGHDVNILHQMVINRILEL